CLADEAIDLVGITDAALSPVQPAAVAWRGDERFEFAAAPAAAGRHHIPVVQQSPDHRKAQPAGTAGDVHVARRAHRMTFFPEMDTSIFSTTRSTRGTWYAASRSLQATRMVARVVTGSKPSAST